MREQRKLREQRESFNDLIQFTGNAADSFGHVLLVEQSFGELIQPIVSGTRKTESMYKMSWIQFSTKNERAIQLQVRV